MRTCDYEFEIQEEAAVLSVGNTQISGVLSAKGYCVIGWQDTSVFGNTRRKPVSETLSRLNGVFKTDSTEMKEALDLSPFEACRITFQYEGQEQSVLVSANQTDSDFDCLISLDQ